MTVSAEEFERWQDDPVTRWVFTAITKGAEENREQWMQMSWVAGEANLLALTELRTRADAYHALTDTSYDGWCETHGEEPVYD